MKANNTPTANIKEFKFNVFKTNKHDTIFNGLDSNPKDSLITEFVKIEKFQGYSNAFNLGLYFRVKNQSSWSKSKQVTGLWKTQTKGVYHGDFVEGNLKTLLLFKISENNDFLKVIVFPKGFYPHRTIIESLSCNY
jgi:hypothetical protein